MNKKYNETQINFVKQYYPSEGAKFCANHLYIKESQVKYLAEKLLLKTTFDRRSKSHSGKRLKSFDKYAVDPSLFLIPNSQLIAYILGLLWADGNIQTGKVNSISLASTFPDGEYFIPLFLKTGKWRSYRYKSKHGYKDICKISTNNFYLAKFLSENDYNNKLKSPETILSKLSDHLINYWFLGFLDGDGSIFYKKGSRYSITFSGAYDQNWVFLINLCQQLNIKYYISKFISKKNHKSSVFGIANLSDVIKLGNFLYSNYQQDGIGLSRKYNKFLEILNIFNAKQNKKLNIGVSQLKNKKWRAYFYSKGKQIHLGTFSDREEALISVRDNTL